jgi:hypothetical protein
MQADRTRRILALPPNAPSRGDEWPHSNRQLLVRHPEKTGEPDDHGIALVTENLRAALLPDDTR